MDAAESRTTHDFFQSFFRAVGAPAWHGTNFSALRDSIGVGQINEIEVPYRLVFANFDKVEPAVKELAGDFADLIHEMAEKGVPVEIRVETSK
jgi:RNAse (barnase) inhibitor barstar